MRRYIVSIAFVLASCGAATEYECYGYCPEPPDAPSQFSILGLADQVGANVYLNSQNAALIIRSDIMTAESASSKADFFPGGYSSNPDNIDSANIVTQLADRGVLSSWLGIQGI